MGVENKMRFALVGCGSVVNKHLVAIECVETAELAAVCDIDPDSAKKVADEAGVPWYRDAREMAAGEDFDVFTILTPSGDHVTNILDLIDCGRHFVVEKPIALRIDHADSIIEACDQRGLKVFVVQQNRFNLPIRRLKHAITMGQMGKLVMGTARVRWTRRQDYYDAKPWRGTWAKAGGVLTNQASHHIDMLVWLMGPVDSVMAMMSTQLVDIEAEDTAVAILHFANGALGIIEATTATRPKDLEGSISVLSEKASVEIGGFSMNELKTWCFADTLPEDDTVFEEWGANPDQFAWNHTEYLRDVVASLQSGTRGLVDGLEARKSLELITALYESAETGQAVHLRFKPHNSRLGQSDGDN